MRPELIILASVIANGIGAMMVKTELARCGEAPLDRRLPMYLIRLGLAPLGMAGGLLIVAAPFIYAASLDRIEVSLAYPLMVAMNLLFVLFLAVLVLQEKVTARKIVGVFLVIGGMILLR